MTSERMLDWVDGFAQGLIHRAARRAPDCLSERLEEEWLADLAERPGRWSRLRFAVGCCWATRVIAHDYGAAALPAASAPLGHGLSVGYGRDDSPRFSRRTATFLLVACLHAAVFYAFAIGLSPAIVKLLPKPFVTRIIDTPPPRVLPTLPQIDVQPTTIVVPIPEEPRIEPERDLVKATPPEPQNSTLPPSGGSQSGSFGSGSPEVNRVQGGPGMGFPSTDDYYPSSAIHMGEKGVATVRACVDGKGRLTSEPAIMQSTGSPRLDDGALRLARAGSGHYRATTENGQPVNACYPFRIRFDLKN